MESAEYVKLSSPERYPSTPGRMRCRHGLALDQRLERMGIRCLASLENAVQVIQLALCMVSGLWSLLSAL